VPLRVTDLAGRSVADASIEFVSNASIESSVPREPTDAILGRLRAPPVVLRGGADGRALLPAVCDMDLPNYVRGPLIAVGAPGRERKVQGVARRRFPPSDREIVVRLGPGHALSGVVVDRDGQPVAGAVVLVAPWYRPSPVGIEHVLPHATCDEDGRFHVEGVGAGRRTLYLHSPDRPLLRCMDVWVPTVRHVVVETPETGAVEGTVVDEAGGAPIPRARVWLQASPFGRGSVGVDADERGRIRVEGVQTGGIWAWAEAPGRVPGTRRAVDVAWVPTDGVLRLDFALRRGAVVRGRVTCEGAPVAGADVFVWIGIAAFNDGMVRRAVTDERGEWRVDGVGAGRGSVGVSAPGMFQPSGPESRHEFHADHNREGVHALVVPESGEVVKDVELTRGAPASWPAPPERPQVRIRGVVIGPDARPPREARVRIARWSGGWTGVASLGESIPVRADGSFEDERFSMKWKHSKGCILWAESVDPPGLASRRVRIPDGLESIDVRLPLRAPLILHGRVTSSGAPIRDARVCMRRRRDRDVWRLQPRGDDALEVHATTDADGWFALPVGRRCGNRVHIQAAGFCAEAYELPRIGGDGFAFGLVPAGEIRGRLLGFDGAPLVGVEIEAPRAQPTTTGADGRFRLRGLALGTSAQVVVDRPRLSRVDFPKWVSPAIAVGTLDAELRVPPGRTLVGRVVDDTGAPAPDVVVLVWSALRDDRFGTRFDTTNVDGRFVVNGLCAPPWRVETFADRGDGGRRREIRITDPRTFDDGGAAEIVFPRT
jgi:protocatechuate 3,4-dioxygenase beta subunit